MDPQCAPCAPCAPCAQCGADCSTICAGCRLFFCSTACQLASEAAIHRLPCYFKTTRTFDLFKREPRIQDYSYTEAGVAILVERVRNKTIDAPTLIRAIYNEDPNCFFLLYQRTGIDELYDFFVRELPKSRTNQAMYKLILSIIMHRTHTQKQNNWGVEHFQAIIEELSQWRGNKTVSWTLGTIVHDIAHKEGPHKYNRAMLRRVAERQFPVPCTTMTKLMKG